MPSIDFVMPVFAAAIPEIFLLTMCLCVLLFASFAPAKHYDVSYYLVQASLVAAFLIVYQQFSTNTETVITFSGHYILDNLALLSKMFIYLFCLFAFAYARDYLKARNISLCDYYLLGLFSILGMSVMVSANSFLTIFLGLELLSLPLYAMIAIHKTSNAATESAMKYFILGSFASALFLYGVSLFYGVTGSFLLSGMSTILQNPQEQVVIVALLFVAAGLLFKFGAVPFHVWVPDVYEGAPTATTLFIASAPKIAAFVITMRILMQAMPNLHIDWGMVLTIAAILSMFMGNLIAIAQTNLKRMLAYSSIAHVGYTLLGIIAGPYSANGYSAAMFYIVTYVLVAAGGFAIITLLSKDGLEFDRLEDYRGLNARNPWMAFMMLLLLFSMAGIPPTVGFFAKLGLLEALVQAHFIWLAVLALVFALVGAYYYLRLVMLMYFEEPVEGNGSPILVSKGMLTLISINGTAALALGLLPSNLINICRTILG